MSASIQARSLIRDDPSIRAAKAADLSLSSRTYGLYFERELAGFIGVAHAVCVSSGTAALHLALAAMGVGPGDEVIIPSFVCSALLNAVTVTGASPVMAEIDPLTLNLDPRDVERRLTRRTKAVVAPHMFGLPADLDRLLSLGVPLVED